MSEKDLHNLTGGLDDITVELPQHQRALKAQLFEQHVRQQSTQQNAPSTFANLFRGTITVKNMTFAKPILIIGGLIAATLLGGTSYALLAGWPGVSTLFGGQTDLDNGNRIVKVTAQNCAPRYMGAPGDETTNDYYYEVNKDSTLTNQQVEQVVQGKCELSQQLEHETTVGRAAMQADPANRENTVYGGYIDSLVKSIGRDGLTIESTVPFGDPSHEGVRNKTFTQTWPHVDPDTIVFYGQQRLSLSDIRPGDHISIKYRANGPVTQNSETTAPDRMDTSLYTVMYITKNLPNVSASIDYDTYYGREFSRVFPCNKHANGFCSMREHYESKN